MEEDLSINDESRSADGSVMNGDRSFGNDIGIQCDLQRSEKEIHKFAGASDVCYFNNCNVTINNLADNNQ